jgi:L,D-peptidoglycan transpeptidase YkuD (ErfK/YbiS/YcfS/YnhG family)
VQALVYPDGRLAMGRDEYRAVLGRAGIAVHKQEGDEATPAGLLKLRRVLFRADRLPRPDCAVPAEPLAPDDGWCDDSGHTDYNRMVRLPHPGRHEALWRADGVYDIVGVLGWNDAPVRQGHGSAIFLHVARPDLAPTQGCIALRLPDLRRVLAAGLTEILVLAPDS